MMRLCMKKRMIALSVLLLVGAGSAIAPPSDARMVSEVFKDAWIESIEDSYQLVLRFDNTKDYSRFVIIPLKKDYTPKDLAYLREHGLFRFVGALQEGLELQYVITGELVTALKVE